MTSPCRRAPAALSLANNSIILNLPFLRFLLSVTISQRFPDEKAAPQKRYAVF